MIFGNINNLSEFPFLEEQVKECFEYAKTHDLASYEKGSHEIDGDRLFVNIVEYTTTTPEERFWEAHKNYLDVHVMIHGNEQIDLNFIQNMELKDFVEKDDFLPMDGEKNSSVVLTDGDFLICYPSDGHRTAVQVQEQILDRLVHTQVHRFFCNISALLPGFLLLNSTHKPEPVPYAPSPSCIQLDATDFLYKKQDVQLDIPATFHPLSALLLMQFSLCHFPVCSRHLLPQFPLHDNLS